MEKPTLKERAETLMLDLKVDQVGLAKFAGITKGAVNQWTKSKPTATMNPAVAYAIADKTKYAPRWLILGEGQKETSITDKEYSAANVVQMPTERVLERELAALVSQINDRGLILLIEQAEQIASRYAKIKANLSNS